MYSEINKVVGLSSGEAYHRLLLQAKHAIAEWKSSSTLRNRDSSSIRYSPQLRLVYTTIVAVLLAIGSVDLENEVLWGLVAVAGLIFLFGVFTFVLQLWTRRSDATYMERKIGELFSYLSRCSSNIEYSSSLEPLTEDMWGQLCVRDGREINLPKILLVRGDTVLLRPGQSAPCVCTTVEGQRLSKGEKMEWSLEENIPLRPVVATVEEGLIEDHIRVCLDIQNRPSALESQVNFIVFLVGDRIVLPIYSIIATLIVVVRFFYANNESLYGTRFVFSIAPLMLLPLLCPALPLILWIIHTWNNHLVLSHLGSSAHWSRPLDLLVTLGCLTGISVVDKKGILSPLNPCLDKVIVFRPAPSSDDVIPEVMDLSSEQQQNGRARLYFDDPLWDISTPQLLPVALNLALNSCQLTSGFLRFLDHLSLVSRNVPRTIVAANRRCMCLFPPLLGFSDDSTRQFHQTAPQMIGFYKRQPGDAPVPGLTKHRTPLEMAFCSLHSDDRSIHSHLSCQGTANIVLEASSHVWNGSALVPLSSRLVRTVKDIYHRNSMTGYCLCVSYRGTGRSLSSSMDGKYVEVPLERRKEENDKAGETQRSHSYDNLLRDDFFGREKLESQSDVIDELFTGHALCGMVVMQYEALPSAVQLVDRMESACVRFVYFSRENELRSRVFAEKLGLEAGWNCHISLAEEELSDEDQRKEQYEKGVSKQRKQWNRVPKTAKKCISNLSQSELILPILSDCEGGIHQKLSPCRRRSSVSPDKPGPMPNKAQLPLGIKAVRPHLESVDNVPLLVGLFTDCNMAANEQMVEIMQEYGEVVLTVGSSLNISNVGLFAQSDLSVSVLPLTDLNCRLAPPPSATPTSTGRNANHLAAEIIGLATDETLDHTQLLLLPELVVSCRHRLCSLFHSMLFLLLASVQLSTAMLLAAICSLPLLFSTAQVVLIVFVQLPLLFFGILWTPFHPKEAVIRIAAKNSGRVGVASVRHAIVTFLVQFLPSAVVVVALFFLALVRNSTLLCSFSDVVCSFGDDVKNLSTDDIRHTVAFHLVFYLCISSATWLFPLSSLWAELPILSIPWIIAVFLCMGTQICFSLVIGCSLWGVATAHSLVLLLVVSLVSVLVGELSKLRRIRHFQREQRRTKLAFDTKLGMNSPY